MARTIRQRPHSLAAKLSGPFLALIIISLLIVGASLTYASWEAQRQRIQENQQKSADYAAATVALYLQQAREDLKSFAQVAYLERDDRERQAATLGALWSGRQAAFESIALLDANGQELAKFATYYTFLPSDLTNQRESNLFQQALSGQVYMADKTETLRDSVRPIIRMGVPIQESSGVIAAEVNVKAMTDAVQKAQIGQSGYAYVIDQAGQLIAHSDPSSFLQFKDKDLTYVPIIAALVRASAAQPQGGYAGLSKTDVIGAYARIGLLPWYVVTELPSAEANVPINNMLVTLAALLAMTLTLSVGVGYWLPRRLIRPLSMLTQGAERIGQGDLSHRIDVKSNDELETLGEAFNAMTARLRDLIGSLETRVAARTAQLSASAEVGRAASTILNPQELLQRTADLICDRFSFYYAGMFLLDENNRFAALRAGTGEPGQKMVASGHRLEVDSQSMVGWVCANRQARIALDVGQDAVRFANPLLPDTRSEIALPLQVGDHILGVLDVQSTQEAAFGESDIATLQSMADQIAIALENARLFAQSQATLSENAQLVTQIQTALQDTTALYTANQAILTAQDNAAVFQAIVDRMLKPDIDLCLLVLFDPYEGKQPQRLEVNQVWVRADPASAQESQPGRLAGKRFDFGKFPLRDFLHPERAQVTRASQAPADPIRRQMWDRLGMSALAFLPLRAGARWIGELVLGTHQTADIFTEDALRPYQATVTQAAVAIENRGLVASSESRLSELSELYRTVTGKAWGTFLQAQPTTTDYEFSQAESARSAENVWRIPLQIRGQEIGIVELESDRQTWSEQERALVEAVVTQTALALDSARLFEQTQRLAGRERLINEITARIRASTSVPGILQTAARELATAMNVPHAVARIRVKADEMGNEDRTA